MIWDPKSPGLRRELARLRRLRALVLRRPRCWKRGHQPVTLLSAYTGAMTLCGHCGKAIWRIP